MKVYAAPAKESVERLSGYLIDFRSIDAVHVAMQKPSISIADSLDLRYSCIYFIL